MVIKYDHSIFYKHLDLSVKFFTDYFNYGFNEVTWSSYCDRQRRMRVNEAGVGMHVGSVQRIPPPDLRRPTGTG